MAVNDKDPTEAILLVEQTVNTFNQIVVGQEGQFIPVPGYPDQPTLAERVKQNLKPSTDAAAGFAAQASASAKAADDSAKLASQISALETVADAIGLAALPLPDVWAPLSDSLRMITGYGRDVLVGSDVVARMVNFSRNSTATYIGKDGQLKTAAANEPRFEKEGLLIEGQSTNLFPWSEQFIGKWDRVDGVASSDANFPNAINLDNTTPGKKYVHRSPGNLIVGATYTITAIVKGYVPGVTNIRGVFANSAQDTSKVVGHFGDYTVLSFTRNSAGNSIPSVTGIVWNSGDVTGVKLCALQIKALPFASSYIPTNGAAVTRAADVATIPQSLNLGEGQLGFSLAVEFDTVNTGPHRILELSDFSSIIADGASLTIRHAGKEVYGINAPLGQRHHIAYSVAADGAITVALNGRVLAPQSRSGGAASSKTSIILGNRWSGANDMAMYGHLRDLKIWTKKPLTAEQLKVASA